MKCKFCSKELTGGVEVCPICEQPVSAPYRTLTPEEKTKVHDRLLAETPMKWYKFIIYFQLILGPLINLGNAIQYFTGSMYGQNKELIYQNYPKLQTADMIYAAVLLAFVGFALYTRYTLTEYFRIGPTVLKIYQLAGMGVSVIYNWYIEMILPLSATIMSGSQNWVYFIFGIVMFTITQKYFGKRSHLFIFDNRDN